MRAESGASVVRETDSFESGMGFVIARPHDRTQAQGPGFCGKEEVLRHLRNSNDIRWPDIYSLVISYVNGNRWL
jgi:hypothetical protein